MWYDEGDVDEYDEDTNRTTWNTAQFILSMLCTMSVAIWFRLPIAFFFGSGWAVVGLVFFLVVFVPPILYTQIRLGSRWKRGFLSIFDNYFPLSLGFGIAALVRNLISVIYISGMMTMCLAYIFFSVFPCDGKYCIGGTYMWGSCQDTWSEGDCKEGIKTILQGPTAEEKFYFDFVHKRTDSISISGGFAIWFDKGGLMVVPHILTWILIFLTVFGGATVFGWLLYFLAPTALLLLLVVVGIFLAQYSNDSNQLDAFLDRYFRNFAGWALLSKNAWDQFSFQPLLWGLLAVFVHVSMAMNLWNGVYPIMGRWIGNGKLRRHLYWVFLWLVFVVICLLPTFLWMAALASSYDLSYVRCQVAMGWASPFVIAPHIFSKFASHKALAVIFFISLFVFLLLSQALLLITTIENIVEHLRHWRSQVQRHQVKAYRIGCCIAIAVMFPLSFLYILRSGHYWTFLVDHYIDRLMCVLVVGQGVGYLISLVKAKSKESKLLKLFGVIYLGVALFVSVAAFIWYTVDTAMPLVSKDCPNVGANSFIDPIPSNFHMLGWFIAVAPVVIGLPLGLILVCWHSKRRGVPYFVYLVKGEKAKISRPTDDALLQGTQLSSPASTMIAAQPMRSSTLRSGHQYQSMAPASEFTVSYK